ncbi:MAG: hypothetical protein JWN15_3656, partial [Firmicutes bacterium]|nr:hypothetical protein [Bacillota bacterium]
LPAVPAPPVPAPRTPLPAVPAPPVPAPSLATLTPGCTGTVSCFLIKRLLPWLLALALIWGATFHPGRRPPLPLTALKYLAGLAAAAVTALLLYTEVRTMADAAYVLSTQTAQGPLTAWVASQAPHGVLQILALSLILAAPVFWLVRGIRLGLPRATFEAWVEVRRLALPSLGMLALAAAVEAYVTPHVVGWLLR